MLEKDKILQAMRLKGPLIPKDLLKEFGTDTFLIGATLSELVRDGKVMITNVKMGGSPFYYLLEHTSKIQGLSKYLNEKDLRAFELLKQEKILKDGGLTPLLRVSLRQIKDFARPLDISVNNVSELFWKWYLLTDNECRSILEERYFPSNLKEKEKVKEVGVIENVGGLNNSVEDQKPIITAPIAPVLVSTSTVSIPATSATEVTPTTSSTTSSTPSTEVTPPSSTIEVTPPTVTSTIPTLTPTITTHSSKITPIKKIKKISEEISKIKTENKSIPKLEKPKIKQENKQIKEVGQQTLKEKELLIHQEIKDVFFLKIKNYFNKNNISFDNVEVIRKGKEIDCIIGVPSPVGVVEYFCKAKTKKKCNDGDLASAFVKGQGRNLPVLFITTGEVTKKAQEMMKNDFKNMKIIFMN